MRNEPNPKNKLPARLKSRQLRIGGYATVITVLFIALVVLVNVAVKAVEDRWALRLDLSYNALTELSSQTEAAFASLDEDVTYYVLSTTGEANTLIVEVLDRYRAANSHISVQVINPNQQPGLINAFRGADSTATFGDNTVIVTNHDNTRFKIYASSDLVEYGYTDQQQIYVRAYHFERAFTQGLLYATSDSTQTVYLLQGHGESEYGELTALRTLLERNNIATAPLSVTDDMPEAADTMLLILSPSRDMLAEEYERIMAYLRQGGSLLFTSDVTTPSDLANFGALLGYYGLAFLDGMVMPDLEDTTQYYPMQQTFLLPAIVAHDITAPLLEANQQSIIMPQARGIQLPQMERAEFQVAPLLMSREGSYSIDIADATRTSTARQPGDPEGPFVLAAAVQHTPAGQGGVESRVLAVGSSGAIVADQILNAFHNGEFLISAIKWAMKDSSMDLNIVSKTAQRETLRIDSASTYYTLGAVVVVVMPLLVLAGSLIVWRKRRHL